MKLRWIPSLLLVVVLTATAFMLMRKPSAVQRPAHPAFAGLLQQMAHECDPANADADYAFAVTAMPTEKARERIIAQFVKEGPALLPDVQAEIAHTANAELRDMLSIVAVALGDRAQEEAVGRALLDAHSPAVRLCAARELRKHRNPQFKDWFEQAMQDDFFVHSGEEKKTPESDYYPVRTVAELALRELSAP